MHVPAVSYPHHPSPHSSVPYAKQELASRWPLRVTKRSEHFIECLLGLESYKCMYAFFCTDFIGPTAFLNSKKQKIMTISDIRSVYLCALCTSGQNPRATSLASQQATDQQQAWRFYLTFCLITVVGKPYC